MYKAWAFIKRDLLIETGYKFAFLLELFSSIFPIVSFFFVSKLVTADGSPALAKYGGGYFPFVMIGVALGQYLMVSLRTFANTIRRSQMAGCLEAILSTHTDPRVIIICSALYSFIMKTFHVAIVFAFAVLVFGVDCGKADVPSTILMLIVTVATFSGLGILSASLILLLKKGDPIEWIFGSVFTLLGGAYFPIEVMPNWMQWLAAALPITYALDGMRLAVLQGHTVAMLWQHFAILGGMAVILLPGSVWTFSRAVEKGRRDGSLLHY